MQVLYCSAPGAVIHIKSQIIRGKGGTMTSQRLEEGGQALYLAELSPSVVVIPNVRTIPECQVQLIVAMAAAHA